MEAKFNLILQTVPEIGKVYQLDSETCSIGRDPENSIIINHPEISRKHALLISQNDRTFIQDLGSMNGTFVDGEKVEGTHALNPGVIISLGETVSFIFQPILGTDPILPVNDAASTEQDVEVEPISEEFEPIAEIAVDMDESGKKVLESRANPKLKEFTRLLTIILVVVAVCVILGFILFLWFIDTYALWCTVLPFLFQPGVCP